MMHDDDEIPSDLRDLFAAARGDDGPPAGAKERVASALSITLGIGIGAAATAATSAAGASMAGASGAASTIAAATTSAAAATTVAATTTAASVAAGTGATSAAGAGFTATGGALAKGLAFVFATAVAGTTGTGIYLAAKDETKPAAIVEVAPSADVPSTFDPKMLGKKPPPPPVVAKPKAIVPVAPAPVASEPAVEVTREPVAPVENTPEAKAERLRGERAVLDTARSAVARGDGGAALIALEAHRASYADGALVEERDALTILALTKVSRMEEARKKAEQFRAKNPHSLFLKAIDGALR
jgi:hypothetical protein